MKLETLLFGDYSKKEIKKIKPLADAVDALADKYRGMTEEELRSTSEVLRARLAGGETLENILPDRPANHTGTQRSRIDLREKCQHFDFHVTSSPVLPDQPSVSYFHRNTLLKSAAGTGDQ